MNGKEQKRENVWKVKETEWKGGRGGENGQRVKEINEKARRKVKVVGR